MMVRFLTIVVLLSCTASGFSAAVTTVSTSDFMAGLNNADQAKIGPTANDTASDVNSLFGGTWTKAGKYEEGSGLEGGSVIDLDVTPKVDQNGFNWSFNASHLANFESAVFVVKQGNPNSNNPGGWVAYLFNDLLNSDGMFYTTNSFDVNDYSHLTIYTGGDGSTSVPEIDATNSVLAIALLATIVGFVRERRRAC